MVISSERPTGKNARSFRSARFGKAKRSRMFASNSTKFAHKMMTSSDTRKRYSSIEDAILCWSQPTISSHIRETTFAQL